MVPCILPYHLIFDVFNGTAAPETIQIAIELPWDQTNPDSLSLPQHYFFTPCVEVI